MEMIKNGDVDVFKTRINADVVVSTAKDIGHRMSSEDDSFRYETVIIDHGSFIAWNDDLDPIRYAWDDQVEAIRNHAMAVEFAAELVAKRAA